MPQFHFDPATYLEMIRAEVPDYDTLQRQVTRAALEIDGAAPPRVLDLGTGTGSTAQAVLDANADARLVLLDENPGMLEVARSLLPETNIERVLIADLSDTLPEGPFDLVVSVLAIHHLDGEAKRGLFAAVHACLRGGGRFVMADVVVPDDTRDAVTPLTLGYDKPDRAVDLVAWLQDAGFSAREVWAGRDLAAFVSTKPS